MFYDFDSLKRSDQFVDLYLFYDGYLYGYPNKVLVGEYLVSQLPTIFSFYKSLTKKFDDENVLEYELIVVSKTNRIYRVSYSGLTLLPMNSLEWKYSWYED